MTRRLARALITAAVGLMIVVVGAGHASAETEPATPADLVLVGVGGLHWSDVDRTATPTLWRMIEQGSVGSISVHTANPITCPADGWLTISAGGRVAVPAGESVDVGEQDPESVPADCAPLPAVTPETSSKEPSPHVVSGWDGLSGAGGEGVGSPGTVGQRIDDAGACTTAAGPGAAIALADLSGGMSRYVSSAADLGRSALVACPVTVIDLGELPADRTERAKAIAALDAELRVLTRTVAQGTDLLVAGVSDSPTGETGLQVAVEWRRGGGTVGWLSSGSTRRPGIVTLADLGATLAQAGGAETSDLDGSPLVVDSERRLGTGRTVENRRYLAEMTAISPQLMPVVVLTAAGAALIALATVAIARRRRRTVAPATRRAVLAVLLLGACTPVGTHLAALSRWWGSPAPLFAATGWYAMAATLAALTCWYVSRAMPAGRWRVAAAVAGVTWLVLTLDGVSGTVLQRGSILGSAAVEGARYYGFGNTTFGVYAASALLLAAALASWLSAAGRRTAAIGVVVAIGAVSVVVDGWPTFGADFGGVLALIPAFAVLAVGVAGAVVTFRRAVWIAVAAVAAVVVVSVVDWARPGRSSHLGLFVQRVIDGDAGSVVSSKLSGVWATVDQPLGAAAAVVCLAVCAALVGPDRWRPRVLRRAYVSWPLLRPALFAVAVAALVGSLVNDSGVVVAIVVLGLAGVCLLVSGLADVWDGLPVTTVPPAQDAPLRRVGVAVVGAGAGLLTALIVVTAAVPPQAVAAGAVTSGNGQVALTPGKPVVVLGTGGLRWSDVDRAATPTLWRLLRDGAAAGGVTPGATGADASCASAGWLALSAGRAPVTGEPVDGTWQCAPWTVEETGDGARIQDWDALEGLQSRSEFDPTIGELGDTLADGGVCATAVGDGAALALARTDATVGRYRALADVTADPVDVFACPLTLVALTATPHQGGDDPAARAQALSDLDTEVRQVLSVVPAGSTVMLVDTGNPAPARPALGIGLLDSDDVSGIRYWSSPSTRWVGVVRLLDLPAALLTAVGVTPPDEFTGSPITVGQDRPTDAATAVRQLADLTARDQALRGTAGTVTTTPLVLALLLIGLGAVLAPRLARRRPRVELGARRAADAVLLVLASLPAGVFLMTTTAWWRFSSPVTVMWLAVAGCTLLVAAAAALVPWRPAVGGPAVVALFVFGLLSLDALLGTPLHRGSLLGPAPTLGGRFYGFGNPTYSVYVVGALVGAAALATWLRRYGRWVATAAAAAVCGTALVVDLWPSLGADVGGGLVLLPAGAIVVLAAAGIRVTWLKLLVAGVAGVLFVGAIAVLDWLRPAPERTHLGVFVQSVADGTAWETISRKLGYAVGTVNDGWVTWVTLGVLVFGAVLLWKGSPLRWPAWERVEQQWTLARPVLLALMLAAVGGSMVNDYGIKVATGILAALLPLLGMLLARSAPVPDEPDDYPADEQTT
ncbi:hypothetical protein [Cellulomonas sp. URHD0024]|uniref:hypothetical protein n=1 Tax=Cellulomonas sp. URHD0024 TaxID=1302620 RepID=UPI0006848927